ncbi:MAG: SsrA-binding protein, partial [bacterium]|nr:SsrA-binding protein [bacterium]
LVPLSLYFDENGRVKVDLALVRGKHTYDKRETIKRREADRDARRSMRRGARNQGA